MPDDTKSDKGFVVMGPELENGGRAALRIDKDGVHQGEMHRSGTAASASTDDGSWTRIVTKPLGNNIHEVIEEESIGRPAMVNSRAYRDNWDSIFGGKKEVGSA